MTSALMVTLLLTTYPITPVPAPLPEDLEVKRDRTIIEIEYEDLEDSFNTGIQRFDYPDDDPNHVVAIGWNVTPGGQDVATAPAMGLYFERNFQNPGNVDAFEFHLQSFGDGWAQRYLSFYMPRDGDPTRSIATIATSLIHLSDPSQNPVVAIDTLNRAIHLADRTVFSVGSNNYAPFRQINAAGTAFIPLWSVDGHDNYAGLRPIALSTTFGNDVLGRDALVSLLGSAPRDGSIGINLRTIGAAVEGTFHPLKIETSAALALSRIANQHNGGANELWLESSDGSSALVLADTGSDRQAILRHTAGDAAITLSYAHDDGTADLVRLDAANHSVAIGGGSTAASGYSVAIGYQARADFANALALGSGARATRANQIMLGTIDHIYAMPGLPTAASNAAQAGDVFYLTVDQNGSLGYLTAPVQAAPATTAGVSSPATSQASAMTLAIADARSAADEAVTAEPAARSAEASTTTPTTTLAATHQVHDMAAEPSAEAPARRLAAVALDTESPGAAPPPMLSAVTSGQFNELSGRVGILENRMNGFDLRFSGMEGGIAAAMAMGQAKLVPGADVSVTVAAATYGGQQGYAGSISGRVADRTYVSGSFSTNTGDKRVGAAISATIGF